MVLMNVAPSVGANPNTFVQCVGFAESSTKLIGRVDRKILIRK